MTITANRPRVFLSSTIYDFADLRSALKFWLEELGYEVNASEYNDFRKTLDLNSYEACLTTIDSSDYFVLLIGSRAGGWFDEPSRTTITMQEYRRAYERAKAGTLKIAAFVRQAVWDVREDRKGLTAMLTDEYAKERGISKEDVERIEKHQSRVVEDVGTVFAFLNEVARNTEMKTATKGAGPRPIGNWIHRFSGFREVVDALRQDFVGAYGLRRVALAANLRAELVENLRHLLVRTEDGKCFPAHRRASLARHAFSGDPLEDSHIIGEHLIWLSMFALTASAGRSLSTQTLDEAIVSGEFLVFDRAHDRYDLGPVQQALVDLRRDVDRLRRQETSLSFEERYWLVERARPLKGVKEKEPVANRRLVGVMSLHDRYMNVASLSRAILVTLDGHEFKQPSLSAGTPFDDMRAQLDSETPSKEDVVGWAHRTEE